MTIPDRVISTYIKKKGNNFNVQSRFGNSTTVPRNNPEYSTLMPSFNNYVPEAEGDFLKETSIAESEQSLDQGSNIQVKDMQQAFVILSKNE
jgi:hypothetical protein